MGQIRTFAIVLGISLVACGATFQYKHYVLDLPSYEEGLLLGPEPEDDLPISTCEPDDVDKGKCVVLLTAEWELLQAAHIDLQERLDACESD